MMMAPLTPHVPVLLGAIIAGCAPVSGTWLDGTFGAGGYTPGLLDAGADRVIGIDRDPDAIEPRRRLERRPLTAGSCCASGNFADLDAIAAEGGARELDGVVLDLGVSSMQLDEAGRGFSFRKDGPSTCAW